MDQKIKCPDCYMHFTTKYSLARHLSTNSCNKETTSIVCGECGGLFGSKRSLANHLLRKHSPSVNPDLPTIINNITNTNTTIDNHIDNSIKIDVEVKIDIVNKIKVLNFPKDTSVDFDFNIERMTEAVMKRIIECRTPQNAFSEFIYAVLALHPENVCIQKHANYLKICNIHKGDGNWENIPVDQAIPIFLHNMTVAAIKAITLCKKMFVNKIDFLDNVREINENNESREYKQSQRLSPIILVEFHKDQKKNALRYKIPV